MTELLTNQRIDKLLRLHYMLMDDKSFFYDEAIRKADAILCQAASDERVRLIEEAERAKTA